MKGREEEEGRRKEGGREGGGGGRRNFGYAKSEKSKNKLTMGTRETRPESKFGLPMFACEARSKPRNKHFVLESLCT